MSQLRRSDRDFAAQYDTAMRHPLLDEYYGRSDFFNYGYWEPGTRSQQEACELLMEKLLARLPDRRGRILDVACGLGATTRYVQRHYPPDSVVGINLSLPQLQRGRHNARQDTGPSGAFVAMDAARLGFGDGLFDNLICVEAAFHFQTRERFLGEAFRVLKPGGRLALSDILFMTMPGRRRTRLPKENYVPGLDQYRELYERAGFEQVTIEEATAPCWRGFRDGMRRWGWQKLRAGELGWGLWSRQMLRLAAGNIVIRHYLLVSARKGSS